MVEPETTLYARTSFELRFSESVDLDAVPEALWWRIALLCLQPHWPLLRPCQVMLPVRLSPGEAEFWLRLTDAAVMTLEGAIGGSDTGRTIEIIGSGPPVTPLDRSRAAHAGTVSCFSGGRDSITQAALLTELGESPTLVTVTAPVEWSHEHDTARRREVRDEMTRRRSLELIEVDSDFRANWDNAFAERYSLGVNELSDTFLYLAAALVVAAARGATSVLMASEADVQENLKRDGAVIQGRHFMYSATTFRALTALFEPAGLGVGSLTSALRQFQVQRLLAERYPDLRDLQYSCWELERGEAACSSCVECRTIALNLVAAGVPTEAAGIDLAKLLRAHADWQPGERYLVNGEHGSMPREVAGRAREMQELRCLALTPASAVTALLDDAQPAAEREQAVEIYERLRDRALEHEIEPEPGYRAGYLTLVDGSLSDGLRQIFDEHFEPEPEDTYADALRNTRVLSDWIAAPLSRPAPVPPADSVRAPVVRPSAAVTLTDAELARIADQVPDPEPELERHAAKRVVGVADTLLDGNELAYLSECVEGNWVSSAGPFVGRLEEAYAEAVGCRHAVACSSGTTALHLALAAAGIGPGDEVIVPAFTMIATPNAATYVGADPVLVDTDPGTWNLDIARLGDKLSRRTRAIVVVHTYGLPADVDAICDFADRNGLVVVEDAAEAHGATFNGRAVGSLGAVAAFSLYGNKILTSGEGGVVTTHDDRIAQIARELRDHAFSPERHFWHRRRGFNFRMSNLQAAVGLAQTERLEELVQRRREVGRRYREGLAAVEGVGLAPEPDGAVTWMFGITVSDRFGISRDELRRRLAARGVETRGFFVPIHMQPIYRQRYGGQRYPVAEDLGRRGLYLPSGPGLEGADIDHVIESLVSSRDAPAGAARPNSP